DRDAHAKVVELAQSVRGAGRVRHELGFGDLYREGVGGTAVPQERTGDTIRERAIGERSSGDVHRDPELEPGVGPSPSLRQSRVEHERGQGLDEAGVLGDRNELIGWQEAELWMVPPHERLDADA